MASLHFTRQHLSGCDSCQHYFELLCTDVVDSRVKLLVRKLFPAAAVSRTGLDMVSEMTDLFANMLAGRTPVRHSSWLLADQSRDGSKLVSWTSQDGPQDKGNLERGQLRRRPFSLG